MLSLHPGFRMLQTARAEMEWKIRLRGNVRADYIESNIAVTGCGGARITRGTRLAQAQCSTLRLRLLNIAAGIDITTRRVWLSGFVDILHYHQQWRTFRRQSTRLTSHAGNKRRI